MQLTLESEYATKTMLHLAEKSDSKLITIDEIATIQKIPEKFLRKIIPKLCDAGLVKTIKGKNGGITLARDGSTITPLDIIQAVEGPIVLNKCLIDEEFCFSTRWCSVRTIWCDLLVEMKRKLSSKSIKELTEESLKRKINLINKN